MTNAICIKQVSKFYSNGYVALDDINLDIKEGEFITILGSSGCGKTTLIKCINRLLEIESGSIEIFGKDIKEQDPILLRRNIGYVIQQIGLFPHMTVEKNIGLLPSILKWDKTELNKRIKEILLLVGLEPDQYLKRYPNQLSGGQQQRVGLARALITNPKIVLFDEPFGALDAITRENLQNELLRIHSENKGTYLFVTHDIKEAFKLGDRILIMNQGKVIQFDTPENILDHPQDEFVKALLKTMG